ncbi:MAG: hypothetical protein IKZ22_04895, partial [Kiritimatiellae bacterium]|nr:hypothetical protein [Kiritimatiellia bacterium]
HEMGGTLDRVKRLDADQLGEEMVPSAVRPRGNIFEITELTEDEWARIRSEMPLDEKLVSACQAAEGKVIIKAAGNMAYPVGYFNETVATEVMTAAQTLGESFEYVAGLGSDPRTMIGAGAIKNVPVLVSVPQLIGGGQVGLCISDSIPVSQRCKRIAKMLNDADVIIESAVALTQEIHDGPFETYTGHGIWSWMNGLPTYSLKEKTLIRFDLDDNLKRSWDLNKNSELIQKAINDGLPKTKLTKIPFRMEMSAFTRLEKSIPVIGDIGALWPVFVSRICDELGVELDFTSAPQNTAEGAAMREWIVDNVKPFSLNKMRMALRDKYAF